MKLPHSDGRSATVADAVGRCVRGRRSWLAALALALAGAGILAALMTGSPVPAAAAPAAAQPSPPPASPVPVPPTPSAPEPSAPQPSQPSIGQKNPCENTDPQAQQSPTCQQKQKTEARLKHCTPDSGPGASPSPSGSPADGAQTAAAPSLSSCVDSIHGLHDAQGHQASGQEGMEGKVEGFKEGQKQRHTEPEQGIAAMCRATNDALAPYPEGVYHFDPRWKHCAGKQATGQGQDQGQGGGQQNP
ncbi:hypothetical protein [Streptomyces iconiensis]|uniref:Uncharacterized protein n=1 Tax=Streptomyces iconiensis TaxID=1384038 RepID=A0ABT6ZVB0_9ACTN|nr:hypothetical protein [Streptomyces iconiensis]MDJ1132762.1 hypothetical protein [Streptomyces iconiensis]